MRIGGVLVLILGPLALGFVLGALATRPGIIAPPPAQQGADHAAVPSADPNVLIAPTAYDRDFVKTALPQRQSVPVSIPVTGKLAYDKQKLRIAAARVAGRLGRIFVFEGQTVRAGDPLAEIYSPDYVSAENELLLARRFLRTFAANSADAALRADAEQTYRAAIHRLEVLGAAPTDIDDLQRNGQASVWLKVRAPISGVVVARNVDPGGYLNLGDTLMTLADTGTLWLFFNLYDADQARVRIGQLLRFQTSSLPGETFTGRVAFIAPSIDPATHTLPVRCDIPNPRGRLRPEMFVSGHLEIGEQPAWIVPRQALIQRGDHDYLFVQESERRYRRLPVQGEPVDHDRYAVTEGLSSTQPVVVEGSALLDQELNPAGS